MGQVRSHPLPPSAGAPGFALHAITPQNSAMTEFKRTVEELASLEELLGSLAGDSSTPAPEKLVTYSAAKVKLL